MVQSLKPIQRGIRELYLPIRFSDELLLDAMCFIRDFLCYSLCSNHALMISIFVHCCFWQIHLKADERDVYEFFSRAGKVSSAILLLNYSKRAIFLTCMLLRINVVYFIFSLVDIIGA